MAYEGNSEGVKRVERVIKSKRAQNPQFEYMWRVAIPDIAMMIDRSGGSDMASYAAINLKGGEGGRARRVYDERDASEGGGTPNVLTDNVNADDAKEVSSRVYEFTAPHPAFDTRKSTHGPSFRYAATNHDIGTVSLVVDEMEDGLTLRFFTEWMNLIKNSDGSVNPPGIYKRDIRFIKLSASQTDIHYSVYKRYFPTEIAPVQYSYDGSGVSQYSITFTGDDVEHTFIPVSEVQSAIQQEEQELFSENYRSNSRGLNESTRERERQDAEQTGNTGGFFSAIGSYFGF